MCYLFVCLVVASSALEVSSQFMPYYQDFRSQQKFMDEGFEYVRESPSFAYNSFQQLFSPQRRQPSRQQTTPQQNVQNRRQNRFNSGLNRFKTGLNSFDFRGLGSSPIYGGGLTSKGFLDEGFEHVQERGSYADMQTLMSNPLLLISAMFA